VRIPLVSRPIVHCPPRLFFPDVRVRSGTSGLPGRPDALKSMADRRPPAFSRQPRRVLEPRLPYKAKRRAILPPGRNPPRPRRQNRHKHRQTRKSPLNRIHWPLFTARGRCRNFLQRRRNFLQRRRNFLQRRRNLLQRCRNFLQRCRNLLQRCRNFLQRCRNFLQRRRNLLQRCRNLLQRRRNPPRRPGITPRRHGKPLRGANTLPGFHPVVKPIPGSGRESAAGRQNTVMRRLCLPCGRAMPPHDGIMPARDEARKRREG
jgi:hypothetical protein